MSRIRVTTAELLQSFRIALTIIGQRRPDILRNIWTRRGEEHDQARIEFPRTELARTLAENLERARWEVTRETTLHDRLMAGDKGSEVADDDRGGEQRMCNDYRLKCDIEMIRRDFDPLHVRIRFPEGIPNLEPRDSIRITDGAPIVRAAADASAEAELVQRRWSWPGPSGKPVYCMRSEGRSFVEGRCLILADGFYEFTANEDPKAKRKHKWLFTKPDEPWFCIAGIWRASAAGEAFTMLTVEPGPDVAPYHSRQVALLDRADYARWLDPRIPAEDLIRPLAAGSLEVTQIA